MSAQSVTYRPDIDGLRAVAVIAVIINHLSNTSLPSGFLGVDVFFVISGFVITGSLLGQTQPGFLKFYVHFFSRRLKRLLPALTVCVGATSLFVLALDPYPEESIRTGVASLFGVANIALYNLDLDYFAASSKYNAFTHTWSLGVEEQFYVIFPVIVWFSYLAVHEKRTRTLALVLSILSIASVFGFFWFYERNHSAAYFLTPTRIWELGIGALAFIGLKNAPFFRLRFDSGVLFNAALIGLLASFFIPKAFSGWTTLVSALLTAALLMSPQNLAMTKVLSLPPTVYVGKISYSLYLWHWPLITLLPYLSNPLLRTTAFTVVAMFVVAIASYHLLEKPLRHARWSNSRGTDVAIGVGASVVFCLAILFAQDRTSRTMETAEVSPYPPAFLPLKKSGLPYNPHCVVDGIKRLLTPDTFQLCTTPAIPGSRMPTIWAMGDSHAGQLQGLLYELHENIGVGIHLIETPRFAFPPVTPDIFPPRVVIFEETLSRLQAGDIVLLSRLYLTRRGLPKPRGDFYTWSERVSRLAVQLEELGVSIVIMGPPPMFQFEDIRSCDPVDVNSCVLERSQYLPYLQPVHHMLDDLAEHHQNVLWFHTFDALCPPTSRYCRSSESGVFLYRDREHLNSYGAKQLATPFVYFLRNSDVLPR